MPLRQINNTAYPPQRIKDLIFRDNNVYVFDFIPEIFNQEINDDWIYYLMQYTTLYGNDTNILSQYIYEYFSNRHFYDRYQDMFEGWDEATDINTFCYMITQTVYST